MSTGGGTGCVMPGPIFGCTRDIFDEEYGGIKPFKEGVGP